MSTIFLFQNYTITSFPLMDWSQLLRKRDHVCLSNYPWIFYHLPLVLFLSYQFYSSEVNSDNKLQETLSTLTTERYVSLESFVTPIVNIYPFVTFGLILFQNPTKIFIEKIFVFKTLTTFNLRL